MNRTVDQRRASATGDVVAGNKTVNNYQTSGAATKIEKLMDRLAAEIREDVQTRSQIDDLQHYYRQRSHDGIDGLEAKLMQAGRQNELMDAFEKKELFVKLLNRFSLYASAQEIFAYMLARGERRFKVHVMPAVEESDNYKIDLLVSSQIIEPLVEEMAGGAFPINDAVMMGMVYWLAEQCFIRWHR